MERSILQPQILFIKIQAERWWVVTFLDFNERCSIKEKQVKERLKHVQGFFFFDYS